MAVVQWSELPYDVLAIIRSRVASPRGRVRFTAVCRSWRRAAASRHPSPPAMPLLLLLTPQYRDWPTTNALYCVEDGEIVMRVRPTRDVWSKWLVGGHDGGWIALWHHGGRMEPSIVIVNLFSGAKVALSEKQQSLACNVCSPRALRGSLVRKIAFSEAPTSSRCILAAITADTCRLAVCKLGCPDDGWATEGCSDRKDRLQDIAFCNGELYGITRYGEKLFKFDIIGHKDDDAPVLAAHLLVSQKYDSPTRWEVYDESVVYLIELRGKLVMAVRARQLPPDRETSFNLFQLVDTADNGYRWVEMRSLEDHALFLGPKCSAAPVQVPGGGLHGVERNTIYYCNHRSVNYIESYTNVVRLTTTDDDDRMYTRKNKRVSGDEINSIGYYVRDGPYTPTWLLPPII